MDDQSRGAFCKSERSEIKSFKWMKPYSTLCRSEVSDKISKISSSCDLSFLRDTFHSPDGKIWTYHPHFPCISISERLDESILFEKFIRTRIVSEESHISSLNQFRISDEDTRPLTSCLIDLDTRTRKSRWISRLELVSKIIKMWMSNKRFHNMNINKIKYNVIYFLFYIFRDFFEKLDLGEMAHQVK